MREYLVTLAVQVQVKAISAEAAAESVAVMLAGSLNDAVREVPAQSADWFVLRTEPVEALGE